MRVSIIGTGYVGLVTGACLADKGHHIICVDSDRSKVDHIARGDAPFHEPGLDTLLRKHVGSSLHATTDLAAAVQDSDLTILATGTPFDGQSIDLSAVKQASRQVGEALANKRSYHAVVVKSTVVPGTTDSVVLPILEQASGRRAGSDFGVGMNPEFLSEGQAIDDFMIPDRIVLGGIDDRTIAAVEGIYASFADTPKLRTSNATAEFIKYASNSLLATLISFSNQIANLCSTTKGVDAMEVMRGVHLARELNVRVEGHARVTAGITSFLSPGCGFGGSCLPKDVKALAAWGARAGEETGLLDSVLRINHAQPARLVTITERALGTLAGRSVAVLGLAFKPGTDDMRESPAVPIIDHLLARSAKVRTFDPVAYRQGALVLKGRPLNMCESMAEAIEGVDAVIIVTRWEQFRAVPDMLRKMRPSPLLVDGRRMFDRAEYSPYVGIGLG